MDAYLHQLRANLDVMRHLPGGTRLPQPATAEERALLADLVHLPESSDPLQWLQDKRGPLTARITLYETLGFLKSFVGTRHRYVVRTSEQSVSAGDVFDSAVYERLNMAFYPAVAADATELRFTSHGIMSLTHHPGLSDDTSLLQDVHVDPFTWRLVIPR